MHLVCKNEGVWLATLFSKPGNALLEAEKCPFDTENAPLCKARKRVKIDVNITFMFQ